MKKYTKLIFIIIEAICFCTYLVVDIANFSAQLSNIIKFVGISLVFIYSIFMLIINKLNVDRIILSIIFALTVSADVFLLLLSNSSIGVLIFCIVQSLYFFWFVLVYYYLPKKNEIVDRSGRKLGFIKRLVIHAIIRISLTLLLLIIFNITTIERDFVLIISSFYAISFLDNICFLVKMLIKKRYNQTSYNILQLLIGMLLFLFCDINVAIFNLSTYLSASVISSSLYSFASVAMWFFYLPSQVLIVTSFNE